MGVVHKLQDDIRDFIIKQKKAFPKISCRKLSDIVYDKFSIVVSKSSIGVVLKAANLNSPIGRHSLSVDEIAEVNKQATKKFQIPQQKKKQLFGKKIDSAAVLSDEKTNLKTKKSARLPFSIPQNAGVSFSSEGTNNSLDQKMSHLAEGNLHASLAPFKENQGILLEKAGIVFLKAVEWNLTDVSILGKVLKDEVKGRFDINFDKLADLLVLSKIFNIDDMKEFNSQWTKEQDSFFWFKDREDVYLSQSVLAAAKKINDCGMKLFLELEILLQEVVYYKITCADGRILYINAKSRNVHCENVQSDASISLVNALRTVDLEFIRNVHSAVCCYSSRNTPVEILSGHFFNSLNNQSESCIKEISLLNVDNVELVKYSQDLSKHKTGVLVVWTWEKNMSLMKDFLKENQEIKSLKILNETYFYRECFGDKVFSQRTGKFENFPGMIAVSLSSTEKPFVVLLTNVDADQEAVKNVVYDFLLTWLGSEKSKPYSFSNNEKKSMVLLAKESLNKIQVEKLSSLFDSVRAFRQILRSVSQQYFFDVLGLDGGDDQIVEHIYGLSGYLFKEDRICRIFFVISEQDAAFLPLKRAIQRFNSMNIFDSAGCRILLQAGSASDF